MPEFSIFIVAFSPSGLRCANILLDVWPEAQVFSTLPANPDLEKHTVIEGINPLLADKFYQPKAWVFIGALPICVRSIAPFLNQKQTTPAVIHTDANGQFAQPVVGSQTGGQITKQIARALGGKAISSNVAEGSKLWVLDHLHEQFGWALETNQKTSKLLSIFLQKRPTALWIDAYDAGTDFLVRSKPNFVELIFDQAELKQIRQGNTKFELLISVSFKKTDSKIGTFAFYPKVLCLGTGCNKGLLPEHFNQAVKHFFDTQGLALQSLQCITSIDLKKQEPAYLNFSKEHQVQFVCFSAVELADVQCPSTSDKVKQLVHTPAVSEPSAMLAAQNPKLLFTKSKIQTPSGQLTLALACQYSAAVSTRVDIVGAGPGDPELITLKGKYCLEQADAVLYAGSLVPKSLLNFCKNGCIAKNTASMTLEEQQVFLKEQISQGHKIVRLQSGDTSFYSAIQEQVHWLKNNNIPFQIIPGVSSFSAAAAVLGTELTAPGLVQTVVLTRAAGKTAMPEGEKLADLAKTGASMCIFLSAGMVADVKQQLLQHFGLNTPAALLYRVGWPQQKIWQGELQDLAIAAKNMKVKRSLLIIVSKALKHQNLRSQLYNPNWEHIFRKKAVAESSSVADTNT